MDKKHILLNYALDIFIIQLFDLKTTITSFKDNNYIYTKLVDFTTSEYSDELIFKKYSRKLIEGDINPASSEKSFTEFNLYNFLFHDDFLLLVGEEEMSIRDFKSILLKLFKKYKFKDEEILALTILHSIKPSELEKSKLRNTKFKELTKEGKKIISNSSFDEFKNQKITSKEKIKENLEKVIPLGLCSKQNRWFNNTVSFPGIYFNVHLIELFYKIINK